MKGGGKIANSFNLSDSIVAVVGTFITIFVLLELTEMTQFPWMIGSFGASTILVFVAWNAPVGQPRSVIGGHLISSFLGILIFQLMGNSPLAISIAICLSLFCMLMTKTFHPPAGSDPLIIMVSQASWGFILSPLLIGLAIILLSSLVINNFHPKRNYPDYW